jgi:pimeloyl-ACP methyl ester carboxylesterase
MKIRISECKTLMDDIWDAKFPQKILGFNEHVKFDLDNFICGGHSFGGMNAIALAKAEPERVKAVYTFDAWLYIVHKEIL